MSILIILGGIFFVVGWLICLIKIIQIIWDYLFGKGQSI